MKINKKNTIKELRQKRRTISCDHFDPPHARSCRSCSLYLLLYTNTIRTRDMFCFSITWYKIFLP